MINRKHLICTLAVTALLSTNVSAAVPSAPSAQEGVLVKVASGKNADAVLAKHGVKADKTLGTTEWKLVKVPQGKAQGVLAKLQKDGDIAAVELDRTVELDSGSVGIQATPNDPSYGSQWYLPNIQVPAAWDITKGTTARTIAIIDTGIDLEHPDLAGRFVAGYDFVNSDTIADDDQGHGTQMAGVAAATGNNSTNIAGVDWYAKLMPVKVLNSMGSGTVANIINGINWAANNGAHVIVMGLGGGGYSQAMQDAINNAHSRGAIVVSAVGSSNISTPSYPAAYNNVVSVTATDSMNKKASFADYGTWVDLAAPGVNILTLRNGGGTTTVSGTSYAAALVGGVASLAWSKNTAYANTTVINRLFSTADAITGTGTYWMYGKVNAYKAVTGF